RRAGIKDVILPRQNEKNVREDLTDELRKGLIIHYVDEMDEVLTLALTPAGQPARKARLGRMSDVAN
ncbi:MAG TPA: S16 family serine protease, partial [Vicinamibacterales bacterium]|nr:S16 family serine protease [Vicinamibacterales bacterium]